MNESKTAWMACGIACLCVYVGMCVYNAVHPDVFILGVIGWSGALLFGSMLK